MRRPPFPTSSRHRSNARARVAGAAGVAVLMAALLAACKDDQAAATAAPTTSSAPTPPAKVGAEVPPPPQLEAVAASPGGVPDDGASAPSAPQLTSTRAQLASLLTNASSCTSDGECKTVSTGAKSCGGPTAYRAYSDKGPGAAQIPDVAQKERDLSMEEAKASHRVSACFMLADPGAHCTAHKCETGPSDSVK